VKRNVVGALALAFAALPAQADIVTVTFTGHIAPWIWTGSRYIEAALIDVPGIFGTPGASLTGDPFTSVWIANVASGNSIGQLLSATLTINDHSFAYGAPSGSYTVINTGIWGIYSNITINPGSVPMNSFVGLSDRPRFPGDLTTPFTYDTTATDNLDTPHQLGGSFSLNPGPDGYLLVDNVTLTNPSYSGPPFYTTPWPIAGTGLPGLLALLLGYGICRTIHHWNS